MIVRQLIGIADQFFLAGDRENAADIINILYRVLDESEEKRKTPAIICGASSGPDAGPVLRRPDREACLSE